MAGIEPTNTRLIAHHFTVRGQVTPSYKPLICNQRNTNIMKGMKKQKAVIVKIRVLHVASLVGNAHLTNYRLISLWIAHLQLDAEAVVCKRNKCVQGRLFTELLIIAIFAIQRN